MKLLGQTFSVRDLVHVVPRLAVVFIIGQTLPFKYSGHPESVFIFEQMGWEPWGRYLIAVIETTAIILLLSPWYIAGAIITLSIISAANFMHFTRLGFNVNGDGGFLFQMSIIVIICSLIIIIDWNRTRKKEQEAHFDFEVGLEEENG
ncbi:MAG: DoxX family protein [Bacteroidota bacterium]